MYRYETHLHTFPVSQCARVDAVESLRIYKEMGYDGVFITNHFLDGNINRDVRNDPYEEQIEFYFSDYEKAKAAEKEIGIKVFLGIELTYKGTDFLVYGLDKAWFLAHPEIMDMKKSEELAFLMESGALVIQAHPFREAGYIDHIRLFPRCVHGVEVINASRTDEENRMADIYAKQYGLLSFAGTDNHSGASKSSFAGMESETPVESELEFIEKVKAEKMKIFIISPEEKEILLEK